MSIEDRAQRRLEELRAYAEQLARELSAVQVAITELDRLLQPGEAFEPPVEVSEPTVEKKVP